MKQFKKYTITIECELEQVNQVLKVIFDGYPKDKHLGEVCVWEHERTEKCKYCGGQSMITFQDPNGVFLSAECTNIDCAIKRAKV